MFIGYISVLFILFQYLPEFLTNLWEFSSGKGFILFNYLLLMFYGHVISQKAAKESQNKPCSKSVFIYYLLSLKSFFIYLFIHFYHCFNVQDWTLNL